MSLSQYSQISLQETSSVNGEHADLYAVQSALCPCSDSSLHSPRVIFAAVKDVKYAVTYYREPLPRFTRGGVMLCELVQGECEWTVLYELLCHALMSERAAIQLSSL